MIRLAVSDLDGTLLTPERRLPENTFEIIKNSKKKGSYSAPQAAASYRI